MGQRPFTRWPIFSQRRETKKPDISLGCEWHKAIARCSATPRLGLGAPVCWRLLYCIYAALLKQFGSLLGQGTHEHGTLLRSCWGWNVPLLNTLTTFFQTAKEQWSSCIIVLANQRFMQGILTPWQLSTGALELSTKLCPFCDLSEHLPTGVTNDYLLCFEVIPRQTIGSFVHSFASSTK